MRVNPRKPLPFLGNLGTTARGAVCAVALGLLAAGFFACMAQSGMDTKAVWTDQEKPIADGIRALHGQDNDTRARTMKELAIQIRQLPAGANKLSLALDLANHVTDGDLGRDTVQESAATLANALHEHPAPAVKGQPNDAYIELAELVRYEGAQVSLDDPEFARAGSALTAADKPRQHIDFALTDLQGRTWDPKDLRGKVVLVSFWATWCSLCGQQMPDLDAIYKQYKNQGLVVLGLDITDEKPDKVKAYIAKQNVSYPILLDPGNEVNKIYGVDEIPRSFVYDRDGKLAAQTIDMRTRSQFLAMLSQAGLKE